VLLVQPSFEEGFGIPVLEAMTLGVPVVAANRGALPEVLGQAGALVNPDNTQEMTAAISRIIDDHGYASACSTRGVEQARRFQWSTAAERALDAYGQALARRRAGRRSA
jgi:glycosyltransferase involved in cell wall biosynthesis